MASDPPIPQRRRGGTFYVPFQATKAADPSPDDEKMPEVVRSKSCRYSVGASEVKGRRPTMEDASVVHGCFGGKDDYDLFCVFDGHGSRHSAAYCAQHLPDRLSKKLKDGVRPDTALRDTFNQVAEELKPTSRMNGTTAAVALVIKSKLWVANVGDSRVVLCRGRTSAVEAREKEKKAKEDEKQKEKEKEEEATNASGKRPMGKRERSNSKSLCVERGSSPSSPSSCKKSPASSSSGPSSPLSAVAGGNPSPTKMLPPSGRENDENPSSSNSPASSNPPSPGPSPSSPHAAPIRIGRPRPHTYSAPLPESDDLPKLKPKPVPDPTPPPPAQPASESDDDSSCVEPPSDLDSDYSDNDNPDSDIIMSDFEDSDCEEEEEEDPIPDFMASRLTYDHRPDSREEQQRIKDLGGCILNGRVNGQLAVTRAIGDAQLHPYVSSDPYIDSTELRPDDEFIVIACDGLFDVFPDDVVVTIARGEIDPVKASEKLTRQAFSAGSTDNISAIVVRLLDPVL